jgi:hypothetical protein
VDRLLERDGELAVLDGLARDVAGGAGRALLIGGVAGRRQVVAGARVARARRRGHDRDGRL